ncbi:hypothetical protein B0G80_2438 [Paraburkholderia sp. BL6669N2]|uniref:hypothetical protein n=1 Tax=Paraburkholderia sp. BL6669N2 TaxID=1938807 RepID=UPI000E25C196|nr:hypothetical protein [Paraburkholderia sp. BL6669N2]REG59667.1 hypothetical protein B0G80_2438 [Paraburkholderia sp. BL6669N2]
MTFSDEIEQQALAARRQMLRSGELLKEDEFRDQLRVSSGQLARMVARGSVFTIEVDGVHYFPSLLAATDIDLKRLYAVCRLLGPAPPSCRLGYLSSRHVNIGGISPLEAICDEREYRLLRRMARAYAAEWVRTVVTIYVGRHEDGPRDIEPTLTAADEVDPRVNLWKRAEDALTAGGYIHPCGPYAKASEATAYISRHPAGQSPPIPEARIDVSVVDGIAHANVVRHEGATYKLDGIRVADEDDIVSVVLCVVVAARKSESKPARLSKP